MQYDVVEVAIFLVRRKVSAASLERLANAPRPVNEDLAESSVVGLKRTLVPQMPLAENARSIARIQKQIRKGCRGERHDFAFENGVGHPIPELVPATKDC